MTISRENETFGYSFAFQHAGVKDKNTLIQLDRFRQSLVDAGYRECPVLKNWYKAFDALKEVITVSRDEKKVVFIDEMPWLDRAEDIDGGMGRKKRVREVENVD